MINIEEFAVSDDESTFAIVTRDFVDYTLWTFSDGGLSQQNFELDDNSQLTPVGPPRFAPGSNNLLAWVYDDENFGQSVVIMNTDNGGFLRADNLGYVDDFAWFPNGDLLIVDGADLSRAMCRSAMVPAAREPCALAKAAASTGA